MVKCWDCFVFYSGKGKVVAQTEESVGPVMTSRKIFSKQVKRYRKGKRWKLLDLQEASGLSYSYLSTVENAKSNISIDNAELIAKALGVPLFVLFIDQ